MKRRKKGPTPGNEFSIGEINGELYIEIPGNIWVGVTRAIVHNKGPISHPWLDYGEDGKAWLLATDKHMMIGACLGSNFGEPCRRGIKFKGCVKVGKKDSIQLPVTNCAAPILVEGIPCGSVEDENLPNFRGVLSQDKLIEESTNSMVILDPALLHRCAAAMKDLADGGWVLRLTERHGPILFDHRSFDGFIVCMPLKE